MLQKTKADVLIRRILHKLMQ